GPGRESSRRPTTVTSSSCCGWRTPAATCPCATSSSSTGGGGTRWRPADGVGSTFPGVGVECDLLVVGGGPAGAAAAIRAAAAGLSVVLCDKASFPRDKTCGDGLTTSALRLLERLGLDPATVDGWQPVA